MSMELFEKKFVYLEWDEVLKGKELFVADTLPELRRHVDSDDTVVKQSVKENGDDNYVYPFVTSDGEICYAMAYYDPNYSCKRAYMEGKQIQYRNKDSSDQNKDSSDQWKDCSEEPYWAEQCEYRVKPEEPEKKWRPFKSIEELKHVWDVKLSPLEEPMIWVRSKFNTSSTYLITHYCGNMGVVHLCGYLNIGLEQLFKDYTFLDGSPCGMFAVEEE